MLKIPYQHDLKIKVILQTRKLRKQMSQY